MRILRLDLGSATGTVDLHPFVSVIHGLSPELRTQFTNAVRSLARGVDTDLGGLIEDKGSLIELPGLSGSIGTFTTEDIFVNVDGHGAGADRLPSLRAEFDQVSKQAQIDAVHVEEIRADLRPHALALVQMVRDQLAGSDPMTEAKLQRAQVVAAVESAIEAIGSINPTVKEARSDVLDIVARWDAYVVGLKEARPHLEQLTTRVTQAEAALTMAFDQEAAAEAAAIPVMLSPGEEARLAELSDAMFDPKARKKFKGEDIESEIEALLAKVDQPTYSSYVVYRMSPKASDATLAAVDAAKQRVEACRVEIEEARAAYSVDPVAFQINNEFDELKTQAREFLGPVLPDDLGAALSGLVIERENPEWIAAVEMLRADLMQAGAPAISEVAPAEVTTEGRRWIDRANDEDQEAGPSREALEAQLVVAEQAFERHARAMSRIDQLEAAATASSQRAKELAERIEAIEAGRETPGDLFDIVRSLAERVRVEAGAACPLILHGEFADHDDAAVAELLEQCETLGHDLQLIVVSERVAASSWAREVGLRRALRSTVIAPVS